MNGEQTVKTVVGILRDGELGYRHLAGFLANGAARSFYLEESRVRSVFASELERVLGETTGAEWASDGTPLGTLHRSWVDLQVALREDDRTILQTTERCEQYAVAGYKASLADPAVSPASRAVLQRQAPHIRRALAIVRKYLQEVDEEHNRGGGAIGTDLEHGTR